MTNPDLRAARMLVAMAFVVTVWAAPVHAELVTHVPASFDCAKATRAVDRFICANAALRWQDLALSRSYRTLRDRLDAAPQKTLVAEQRDWLGERDRRCVADRSFAELNESESPAHDQAYDCLMTMYGVRRFHLENRATPPISTRDVRQIKLDAIVRARPELVIQGQVPSARMRLSPDGSQVAILLPSQETDFADQVWLYRVADQTLVAATPTPDRQERHPADAVATINALAWQGETLFIEVSVWGDPERESGENQDDVLAYYAATTKSSRRLDQRPEQMQGRWELVTGESGAMDGDFPDDQAAVQKLRSNRRWQVWAANRGQGTLELYVRERKSASAPYLVAWGGWELMHFWFDASRAQLIYSGDTGLMHFDLATRTQRRIAGTSISDEVSTVSADLRTLIWSTRTRCGDTSLAPAEDDPPEHFCIATMASGE